MSAAMPEAAEEAHAQRADARRSIAAILDAAVSLLAERPDASMAEIAAAAGVARQTVYAHFDTRAELLSAVAERALARATEAIDSAAPAEGPPREALDRLVTAWWDTVTQHARVLEALASAYPDHRAIHELHGPILERLTRLVRRGQRSGDFDPGLPATWLASAFLGLVHVAADEVAAGRLGDAAAGRALGLSVSRVFGAAEARRA